MGALSIWHILLVVVVFAVLFGGRGKISSLMGDTAKGIRAFRDGLKNEDAPDEAKKSLPQDEKDSARS
ncbi:twin-arginine translocase TatA/TatE family subunit [Phenylobacterium sp. SCN 70-31]|uniref:twin-arginine translocase TatA/TatE family subunit n=1 Tax=Phenylobacterium sp. SCN 70-31 TaxID=1660129 RepID=UPI00086C6726|nr:twin-arginine translocase TatA/TatE family subunit [Phenylobacterium sp. SCN 70-31]ODT87084.1 MAG: preprotein translocase subunit TatA [Phenylobacterium sp. SCN 70-31]